MNASTNEKLEICKSTREIAADALYQILTKVLKTNKKVSEIDLQNLWLKEMQKNKTIFPNGWYDPPPYGIAVLFGNDKKIDRVNYKTIRPKEFWPKKNEYLNKKNGLVYLFACPVNKKLGMIGDFGITIYLGDNKKIKDHLILCYKLTKKIFDYARLGMKLSHLARHASKIFQENNLINTITSSTDPIGTNIGHTIPSTDKGWSSNEQQTFNRSSWKKVCAMVSKNRIFINEKEQSKITRGMAITIEPRQRVIDDLTLPMASFHTIALFYENGKKQLLTDFDKIFSLVGMDYMLE